MTYLDLNGIKQAFAEHLMKYVGYSESDAKFAVSDFPDPFRNGYLNEEFIQECEIDGVKYEQHATAASLFCMGIMTMPMFSFYTYYNAEDVASHKVEDILNARRLFQIDDLNMNDFPDDPCAEYLDGMSDEDEEDEDWEDEDE